MPSRPADSSRARQPLPAVILLLCGIACLAWMLHGWGYLEDDGWIHLEFARSLASGQGFAFNGRLVYGDTTPLWPLLLAAVHLAIPDWVLAAKLLNLLACAFTLTTLYGFGKLLSRGLPPAQNRLFAALGVAVVVFGPYFGYWSFSGMETITALGVAALLGILVSRESITPGSFLLTALLAGITPLLRPEMGILGALVGVLLLIRLLRAAMPARSKVLLLAVGLVLFLLPFGLWAHYALHAYGTVLPTTNAAKRATVGDSVLKRIVLVYGFGFPIVPLGAIALALLAWKRPKSLQTLAGEVGLGPLLLALWTLLCVAFYIVDHTFVQTRYIFVNAPLMALLVLALLLLRSEKIGRSALALTLVTGLFLTVMETWPMVGNKVIGNRVVAQMCAFMRSSLPPGAPVAIYSIGEVAFLSGHPVIDTGGITRPDIMPYLTGTTIYPAYAWAQRQGAQYSVSEKPNSSAKLIWERPMPSAVWQLNPKAYAERTPLQLWTLPAPAPNDPLLRNNGVK